jgi:hypothetical protein
MEKGIKSGTTSIHVNNKYIKKIIPQFFVGGFFILYLFYSEGLTIG